MPVTVKVGVTWRRDGREAAHQGDIQALQSMGDSEFILDVYSLIWANAPVDPNTTLKQGNLEEMDVLVVPGGPHANQSQVSLTLTKEIPEPKNTPPTKDKNYASARASSELDLIEKARYLGMPILAFCGGSWRLLQSYGGQTIEVGSLTNDGKIQATPARFNGPLNKRHAGNMQNVASEFQHGVDVVKGTMLGGALTTPTAQKPTGPALKTSQRVPTGPVSLEANSVHWAVAREGSMGKLPSEANAPFQGLESSNQLQVNARDSGPAKTVEGFETRHGAPVVGMQWHPEYMLPTKSPVEGETGAQTNSRQVNYQAIRYILEAGAAYQVRRATMKAIREHFGTAFVAKESKANVHFPEQTKGSGARAVPQGPPTSRVPMSSSANAVTTYLGQFKRTPPVLTWAEWTNLMNNRPLSQPPEPGQTPDYAALAQYLNRTNGGPARFIGAADLQKAKQTLNTGKTV